MDDARQEHNQQIEPIEVGGGARRVRVGYAAQGFGPALVVERDEVPEGDDPSDAEHGLLTVGLAVVTLEIPRPDGTRATLAWDPAEVSFDPLVA